MTYLQDVYDSFFIKTENDYSEKQDKVYQLLKVGIGKAGLSTPEILAYKVYTNNSVITIYNVALNNGNITITINSVSYIINISSLNTRLEIANAIISKIKSDWTVSLTNVNYPMITITKSGIDVITTSFSDTDTTGIDIEISKTYDGEFSNELTQNTIELIALYMRQEELKKSFAELEVLKQHLGTKDFNRLPENIEYKSVQMLKNNIEDEIYSFRQEFYNYSN
jgi:hypothetical protein